MSIGLILLACTSVKNNASLPYKYFFCLLSTAPNPSLLFLIFYRYRRIRLSVDSLSMFNKTSGTRVQLLDAHLMSIDTLVSVSVDTENKINPRKYSVVIRLILGYDLPDHYNILARKNWLEWSKSLEHLETRITSSTRRWTAEQLRTVIRGFEAWLAVSAHNTKSICKSDWLTAISDLNHSSNVHWFASMSTKRFCLLFY